MPRVLVQPPGYPPTEEYGPCDKPHELDLVMWIICVEKNNW